MFKEVPDGISFRYSVFLMHIMSAPVVGVLGAVILEQAFGGGVWIDTAGFCLPMLYAFGLVRAFPASGKEARWVWVVGVLYFLVGILMVGTHFPIQQVAREYLLFSDDRETQMGHAVLSDPALGFVAYSVGAIASLRVKGGRSHI